MMTYEERSSMPLEVSRKARSHFLSSFFKAIRPNPRQSQLNLMKTDRKV